MTKETRALLQILRACRLEFPSHAHQLQRFESLIKNPLRRRIIDAMEMGAAELEEIARESYASIHEVKRELDLMVAANLVERRHRGQPERARGQIRALYFLRDAPSGCAYQASRGWSRIAELAE